MQLAGNRWYGIEELAGFLDGHFQYLVDAFALVLDLQGFAVIALALAHVAGNVDVRQKVHFDLDQAVALAGLAASALDVEGEPPCLVAARAGFLGAGKQVANRRKQSGIGCRVGAWRAADRALVDIHYLVQVLQAVEAVVGCSLQRGRAVQCGRGNREQSIVDQCRFARAGYPGHAGQQADRDLQVDLLQVIAARALEAQPVLAQRGAFSRHGNLDLAGQVFAGQRGGVVHHLLRRAF